MCFKERFFKPVLSFILVLVIVLTALPLGIFSAEAASPNMKTSDAGIEMIKSFEGFLEYAVWDYGQWSIGYGTGVPEGQYPNGISREEAEVLLRQYLDNFENRLNQFMIDYNVSLNQNQFDALISFIYNLGPNVLYYEKMTLRDMIVSGDYTPESLTAEFKTWSYAGGVQLSGLVRRRQAEAELFLTPYTYYEIWEADVENSEIRLRTEPNLSADVLTFIPDGMKFLVTDHKAGDGYIWGYTTYNGVSGWCALSLAEQVFTSSHSYNDKILNDWCFPILDFSNDVYENKTWLIKGYSSSHTGVGIGKLSSNTPVYASKSGWIYPQNSTTDKGNWVIIDHTDGTYSSYQKLSSTTISKKQWVNKGDVIGYCGSSTNDQLFFEVRIGATDSVNSYTTMQTVNPEYIAFNYSSNLVHSVSHSFSNNNLFFTIVTDTDKIDRVKVALSSDSASSISYSEAYSVNSDGDYVWSVSIPKPTSETEYSIDVRSSVSGNYLKRYFDYTVNPSVSSSIRTVSHEYTDGKLVFSVISIKGDYDRIKLTYADDLSSSLAVSTSYAKTPTGDFLWTVEYETDSPTGKYAFDLRSATEEKYHKDYMLYDIGSTEENPDDPSSPEIWRIIGDALRLRSSYDTSSAILGIIPMGTYVTVSEKVESGGYTWGKVSYSTYSGWCALDYAEKLTLPSDLYNDWYWPVPSSSPEVYTNNSWLLTDYTTANNGIDITNVSTRTPVYAAKSGYLYTSSSTAAIIDHYDNSYSSYSDLSSVTVSNGTYVNKGQLIGYCSNTKVHFEIRIGLKNNQSNYSLMVSINPQLADYTYDSELIKSVTSTVSGKQLILTVTTQAGDFNRIKLANANDLSSYIKYTNDYKVNSNGEFVWTITTTAPNSDTSYALDLRGNTTSKYLKSYYYFDYEVAEASIEIFKSVSHEIVGDRIIFTVVTDKGDYNRMKLSLASNISSSVAVSNSFVVNSNGEFVWTIKYAAPKVATTYAFDLRSSVTSKYIKEYYTYTVTPVYSSPILYSTSKIEDGRVVFNVVTESGDYNRVKVTTEDDLSGSIAVSSSYTVNDEGNYVWEISTIAPNKSTTYAFDLRSSSSGKYLKDYYYQEVLVSEEDDVTPILAVSPVISDNKIVFTIVTGTAYNRVKVVNSNDMSSYISYTKKYVEVGSVRIWTITIDKPNKGSILMFDARANSNNKYTKNYYSYTVAE